MKGNNMEKGKVICRRCKRNHDWEIAFPTGELLNEHYKTREECLKEGLRCAEECGCDLVIDISNDDKLNYHDMN